MREIGNPARRGTAHRGEQWVADKPTELKTLNIAVKRRLAVATFLSEHSDGFGESHQRSAVVTSLSTRNLQGSGSIGPI